MSIGIRNVSITAKMIAVILVSILVLASVLYAISMNVLPPSYSAIEEAAIVEDLERAHDALQNIDQLLREKLLDWAAWDDTYQFVIDTNEAYIDSNLNPINLSNLNINVMIFANSNGEVIFKRAIEIESVTEVDATDIETYFESHPELFVHTDTESVVSGLLPLSKGAFIFASQPVLTSDATGPIQGSLTFGKYVDTNVIGAISELTHLSVSTFPYGSALSPEDVKMAEQVVRDPHQHFILPLSEDSIAAYEVLHDYYGNPLLTLKVETAREIYTQGKFAVSFFMVTVSVLFTVFGLILIVLLKWFVVSRFTRLEKEVKHIGDTNDLSRRITDTSSDEIGVLASAINGMLDKIAEAEKAEDASNQKVLEMSEELQKRLADSEKMNKMMVNRELKMVELKKELEHLKGTGSES